MTGMRPFRPVPARAAFLESALRERLAPPCYTTARDTTQLAVAPRRWRYADNALEFTTEMIDIAEAANCRYLRQLGVAVGHQRLRIGQSFALQPFSRAHAQVPLKEPSDLRFAETRKLR